MLKISSKQRRQLKENLLKLFSDEKKVKPEILKLINSQMLLLYGTPDNTIETILDEKDFPTEDFVKNLLSCFRQEYTDFVESVKSRQYLNNDDNNQVDLSLLISKLGKHVALAQDEIDMYLKSDHRWLASTGAELLGNCPTCDSAIIKIFNQMEKIGITEYISYSAGNTLLGILRNDPALFNLVFSEYQKRNKKFKEAILWTFNLAQEDLPADAENLILETSGSSEERLESTAVIALCKLKHKAREAVEILTQKLDSKKWFIRGNAVRSLGLLQVSDERIIKKIEALIYDEEGDDWSVEEAAIIALGDVGPPALPSVSALLKLLSKYHCDMKQEICEALGKIGHASEEVIDALIKVIEQEGCASIPSAIIALGRFGAKSARALPSISKFIYEDDLDYSEETMQSLWEALVNIEGDESELAQKILKEMQETEEYLQKVLSGEGD